MKKILVFLAAIAVFYDVQCFADVLEDKVITCSKIENNIERLECYDQIASKNKKVDSNLFENWLVSTEISKLTDKQNVFIYNQALSPIMNSFNQSVTPTLILRCRDNKTDVFVNWDMYLGIGNTKVTERIDKGKVRISTWNISTDHKATFKSSPIAFIKNLFGKQKLLLEVTPYGESPRMIDFDISGLEKAIIPLQNACGWK